MNWTLALTLALCAVAIAANAARYHAVGKVRASGLAVCAAWAVQQGYWTATGEDSLALFLLGDMAILWLVLRHRHWSDMAIGGLMAVCWACYGLTDLWGPERHVWWMNWCAVVTQMVLGLPWPAFEPTKGMVTHGPLRAEGAI